MNRIDSKMKSYIFSYLISGNFDLRYLYRTCTFFDLYKYLSDIRHFLKKMVH